MGGGGRNGGREEGGGGRGEGGEESSPKNFVKSDLYTVHTLRTAAGMLGWWRWSRATAHCGPLLARVA